MIDRMSVSEAQSMEAPSPEALADLGLRMRRFRPRFHRHLLEWFRSPADAEALASFGLLFQQYGGTMPAGPVADLFQLTATYMGALQRGEMAADTSSQTLMGHLDRVLKPLAATPVDWPGADIRNLLETLRDELSRAGIQPTREADMRARDQQGSAAAPSALWRAIETPATRPSEGASATLRTSDFSLPVAAGDATPAPIPSPLMPVPQAPSGVPLTMTGPLIESAESWLEAQAQRPQVETLDDPPAVLEGLTGLGMDLDLDRSWQASVMGAVEGVAEAEESSLDPFAGLGMVISADDLPKRLGQPTAAEGDDATVDALFADSMAGLDSLPGVDRLPALLDLTFRSGEDVDVLDDRLVDPMAAVLGVEHGAEPLPDLLLESLDLEPLDLEPLKQEPLVLEPGAAATDQRIVESLAAELGAVAPLQMLPELHPMPYPGPSTTASPPAIPQMAADERTGMTADALAAELDLAFDSLLGATTEVMEPLPVLPSVPAIPQSPDLSAMSPGGVLPPAVRPAMVPAVPSVGSRATVAAEPFIGAAPSLPQPRPHSGSLDLDLDVVAEIGLNCARLAQGNSQMGCGLAEFDLNLRHLRQQLRRLEAEARVQEHARSGGLDRDSTLRQGIPGLREVLTQLADLRDQLASYQRESAELLAHQTRLADALQDGSLSGRPAGAT
jgi:hypothetical protein